MSPFEAARHPFLAPECALGFLLPPGYWTQGLFPLSSTTLIVQLSYRVEHTLIGQLQFRKSNPKALPRNK